VIAGTPSEQAERFGNSSPGRYSQSTAVSDRSPLKQYGTPVGAASLNATAPKNDGISVGFIDQRRPRRNILNDAGHSWIGHLCFDQPACSVMMPG